MPLTPAQLGIQAGQLAQEYQDLLDKFRQLKPNDRSDEDRRYAIVITEMEKALAYFDLYVVRQGNL